MLNLSLFSIAIPTIPLKLQIPTLLIKAFECRVIDINKFSPLIDAGYIYFSITRYERYIKSHIAIINGVGCYYGLFTCLLPSSIILKSDPMVTTALNKDKIKIAFLDYYGQKY